MSNIEVSKSQRQPATRSRGLFEEFRDEMNRVFERFETGWPHWPLASARWPTSVMVPELDVHENDKSFSIEVELPGVEEKDVSVTFNNGYLTVKGEKKSEREEKKENYYLAERSFGSFERSLRLPDTLDESKIVARFDKGVLKISAPKRPEAVKAERKIEIAKG
ncbi:MAG TPA: Hsp20/alpha crystallin family protein [Hyphomicrobium sp.]|jgi:HSP20 family protein